MDNRLREAFDAVKATERLKQRTKTDIREKSFDYGRDAFEVRGHRRRIAGCIASVMVFIAGAGTWFMPVTSIGLDVNPSIEVRVNVLDRAISVKGLNGDGKTLAENMDVKGLRYDEAMHRILISDEVQGFVKDGRLLSITVVGRDTEHTEEMLNKVVCRAYALAEEENVLYCSADKETVLEAREEGMTVAAYKAWQQLKETDPYITAEYVEGLSVSCIREIIGSGTPGSPCEK